MAITPTSVDAVELLNKVTSFYELAWSHLLWFIGVAGAIIGIIVPIAIQVYQRRAFKLEESRIESRITERFLNEKSEMLSSVNERLEEAIKNELAKLQTKVDGIESNLTKKVNKTRGAVYHIQGNYLKSQGVESVAISSYISAAKMLYDADDEMNLQKALTCIESCLQKLSNDKIEKYPEIEEETTNLIATLSEKNPNGRYSNYIRNLEHELRNATNREKKVEQNKLPTQIQPS